MVSSNSGASLIEYDSVHPATVEIDSLCRIRLNHAVTGTVIEMQEPEGACKRCPYTTWLSA